MIEREEAELIALAVTGNLAAYGELVRRHQQAVRNWLRKLERGGPHADDIAQEAFVAAWQHIADYRAQGSFISWLLKIAWRAFLQQQRRQRGQRALQERIAALEVPAECREDDPRLPDLDRLLAVLDLQERAVLLLCYGQGCSHSEISATLELPLGTVKSILRRGILKIRDRFGVEV